MRTVLRPHETLVFTTGKHWIALVRPSLLFLGSLVFMLFFKPHGDQLKRIADLLSIVFILISFFFLAYAVLERKTNIWVITSSRIIDEWGIISANAKESLLDKINNVQYRQSFLGQFLNYGDVEIQTAAEQGATTLATVAAPVRLHEAIISASEAYRKCMLRGDDCDPVCPQCHRQASVDSKYCSHCGSILQVSLASAVRERA